MAYRERWPHEEEQAGERTSGSSDDGCGAICGEAERRGSTEDGASEARAVVEAMPPSGSAATALRAIVRRDRSVSASAGPRTTPATSNKAPNIQASDVLNQRDIECLLAEGLDRGMQGKWQSRFVKADAIIRTLGKTLRRRLSSLKSSQARAGFLPAAESVGFLGTVDILR